MKYALFPVIVLCLLPVLAGAQDDTHGQAWALLQPGRDLLKAGNYAEAEQKFLAARDCDPRCPDVYLNLGTLYAILKDKPKAVDAYGQLLTLKPDNEWGRREMKRLFFEGQFPRVIRATYLPFSGVGFANDQVRLLGPSGETNRRITYTTSMLFHEDMGRGDGPVMVALPVTGNAESSAVNRSCYGFTMPADGDRYTMAFALSYPSELLEPYRNCGALSSKLTHLLLRFYSYERAYLGLPRDFPENCVTKAYLCKGGPTGAETYRNALYFFDLATDRSSVEWARQAAHELGHLLLPEVGRFQRPEAFANGYLGERLLMQYLAQEAGLVAGDPWPSASAQQAVNALWPGEEFKLSGYIEQNCRTSLDYWLAAGPSSPLAGGAGDGATGEDAMQYYIGFMLWTQAGFGTDMLRQVLQNSATEPKDSVNTLKAALTKQAEKGTLELSAGAVNLAGSQLATKPLEGALGRTQVQLGPEDHAAFTMYLPTGAWTVQTAPAAEGLSLTIDGKGPLPFADGSVTLGRLDAGWHSLTIQAGEKTPVFMLGKLVFKLDKEA